MGTLRLALAPDRRDAPADDREDAREDDFEPLALEALFVDDDSVFEDEDSDLVLFMVSDRERLEASIVGAETFRRGQRARASGRARRPTGRARSDARCPSPTSLMRAAMKSSAPPRVALGGLRDTRPTRLGSSPAADDGCRAFRQTAIVVFAFLFLGNPARSEVESREAAVLESFLSHFFRFRCEVLDQS
jgi:hypothetical protein